MTESAYKSCCALRDLKRFGLRGAPEGTLFTCDRCGCAFRRHWGQWVQVSVADEIKDLMATHPLAKKEGRMGVEITAPNSPFDPASIKKSVEDMFIDIVPPGAHGALVAIATPQGVKLAVAHRFEHNWEITVEGEADYSGHITGAVKLLRTW